MSVQRLYSIMLYCIRSHTPVLYRRVTVPLCETRVEDPPDVFRPITAVIIKHLKITFTEGFPLMSCLKVALSRDLPAHYDRFNQHFSLNSASFDLLLCFF